MKNNHLKLIIILLCIISTILFNIFVINVFAANIYSYLLFWVLLFIILKFMVGFAKDKSLYQIDILQLIFIFSAIYLILTYILGFATGFVKNPYRLSLYNIAKNMTPALIIVIIQELVRYMIINKSKEQLIFIYIYTFLLIVLEIMIGYNSYAITTVMGIFELIVLLVIASIIKNIFLSYITFKNSYKSAILYRIIFEMPIYFLPIFPNLGAYIEGVFAILFPAFLFLQINNFYATKKSKILRTTKIQKIIFWIPTITILGLIISLVSGLFKIYIMTIGSNSMYPLISKGDVIIVEKIKGNEFAFLKIGDIIAYEYDKRIIVHRIVEISKRNKRFIYITKGDNNEFKDGYEIEERNVRGIIKAKIRYIGYPSVWINELIQKER